MRQDYPDCTSCNLINAAFITMLQNIDFRTDKVSQCYEFRGEIMAYLKSKNRIFLINPAF
jgi:hypothetical protein